ncbi:MAG: 3-methyl-2-oxobutanoate hydroxymethyltransferase [candidate division WOR-3 bacterium]|nr:MAG: 3-methyl-2-oxobutanoate hydroxymethyltransferase [candidate division WOR-3 bacterium]
MPAGREETRKVTVRTLARMKRKGERIVALTAYDYPTAMILDKVGVDLVLVGDSAANVVYGDDTTLKLGMDEMLYHTRAVCAGIARSLVVADMPFLSFQVSVESAVENAGRFLKAGAEAVKLEGAGPMVGTVKRLVELGMPVMGHLGLTPQSVHKLGGYRLQARTEKDQQRLVEDAVRLQEAGCFALVVEKVPAELAARLTAELLIPVIGIGAGPDCDGQILVLHDMLGIFEPPGYKFVKRYAEVGAAIRDAVAAYADDVRAGRFPAEEHSFHIPPKQADG